MTKNKYIIFLTLFLSTVCSANPPWSNVQELANHYLQEHNQDENISAVGLTVLIGNRAPMSAHVGTTEYNGQNAVIPQDISQIGSITKSFISVILLQLESDPNYHFSIDDPITTYFPEYPNWSNVTVKEMLNMTSGVPDGMGNPTCWNRFINHPYQPVQAETILNCSYALPMNFQPGTSWNYSNTNYILAGQLIERITGQTLTEEINNRILTPLHLAHTYYLPDLYSPWIAPYIIHGYDNDGVFPTGTDVTYYSSTFWAGAGGMSSTSDDVATWVKALFATPNKLLNATEYQKLISMVSTKTGQPIIISPQNPTGYGLGVGEFLYEGHPIFAYEGETIAGRALYIYDKVRDILVSATLNSSTLDQNDHINSLVFGAYNLPPPK